MNLESMMSLLTDFGVPLVISGVSILLVFKYFKKKIENNDSNIETMIEQNEKLVNYMMDTHKEQTKKIVSAITSLEQAVDNLLNSKEVSKNNYRAVIFLGLRLLKNRLNERMNQIIERNNILENKQEIVTEVATIFREEIEWLQFDTADIKFNEHFREEIFKIFGTYEEECVTNIKMSFAEVEKKDLKNKADYDRLNRRIRNFIGNYIITTTKEMENYFKNI